MQGISFQSVAVKALRQTTEASLVEMFEDSQGLAIHTKRRTKDELLDSTGIILQAVLLQYLLCSDCF